MYPSFFIPKIRRQTSKSLKSQILSVVKFSSPFPFVKFSPLSNSNPCQVSATPPLTTYDRPSHGLPPTAQELRPRSCESAELRLRGSYACGCVRAASGQTSYELGRACGLSSFITSCENLIFLKNYVIINIEKKKQIKFKNKLKFIKRKKENLL